MNKNERLKRLSEMIEKADMDLLDKEEIKTLTNIHIALTSFDTKSNWTNETIDDVCYTIYNILG